MSNKKRTVLYEPGSFESENHYYTRVLNAQLHPLVKGFMGLGPKRIAERYNHLHPRTDRQAIEDVLTYESKYVKWAGADLFCVTNNEGIRRVVVIELNSCPSGQKSMPLTDDNDDLGGYKRLLEKAFLPGLKRRGLPQGGLAVLYDKNLTEASGYASCLAELTNEKIYLVPFYADDDNPKARFTKDGVLEICDDKDQWITIKGAVRYVTQKPWTRIPATSKTFIFNPVLTCLAGGRNKLLASKAYDFYNADIQDTGLSIRTPETIWDVSLEEVPMWIQRMGGIAVVKNPYSNAGQGVYTITNEDELQAFMNIDHSYQRFIVQALIGNSDWSSQGKDPLYHLGTVPDKKRRMYVADLRFMIGSSTEGFFPVAIYARRAKKPLASKLEDVSDSWEMLGTNLSYKDENGEWQSESERLMLMDNRDFNRLGIGLDDLIESYLQTIQAAIAVDHMAKKLVTKKGSLNKRFFKSINPDMNLISELYK